MSSRTNVWSARVAMVAALACVASASAQDTSTCSADTDCDKGMVCKVTGGTACASPVCPEGQKCPQPEPCTTMEFKSCVPGPCTTDSDCAADMVCYAQTQMTCTGGAAMT